MTLKKLLPTLIFSIVIINCEAVLDNNEDGDADQQNQNCHIDYDCSLDYICGEQQECIPAEESDERIFDDIELAFSEGSEVYLLALYNAPLQNIIETPNQFTSVAINILESNDADSDGNTDMLMSDRSYYQGPSKLLSSMIDRIKRENQRYERVARHIEKINTREIQWPVSIARQTSCSSQCSSGMVCIHDACTDAAEFSYFDEHNSKQVFNATLLVQHEASPSSVAIFVDEQDISEVDQADVASLAETFAEVIGPRDRAFFYSNAEHIGKIDRDSNEHIIIILSSKLCSMGVLGYFDDRDFLDIEMDNDASGNNADILWARPAGIVGECGEDAQPAAILGTLAHEYQHMINYAQRVYQNNINPMQEVLWLDEGLAHLAEDLSGYGNSNIPVVVYYLTSEMFPNVAFSTSYPMVGDTAEQHIAMRGGAYLFLRYLFEQLGGVTYDDAIAGDIADNGGITFLKKLYTGSELGLQNVSAASGNSISAWYNQFVETLYFDDIDRDVLYETVPNVGFNTPNEDTVTGYLHGMCLRECDREDANGESYTFEGPPEEEEFDDGDVAIDATLVDGGVLYYRISGAEETIILRGTAQAGYDAKMKVWRIE